MARWPANAERLSARAAIDRPVRPDQADSGSRPDGQRRPSARRMNASSVSKSWQCARAGRYAFSYLAPSCQQVVVYP